MAIGEGLIIYSLGGVILCIAIAYGIREHCITKRILRNSGKVNSNEVG